MYGQPITNQENEAEKMLTESEKQKTAAEEPYAVTIW